MSARRRCGIGVRSNACDDLWWPPVDQKRKRRKKPDAARFLLTRCSGGSDRTLPPSVRSILVRSKTPRITTRRVRWTSTEHSQSPVQAIFFVFDRPDAEPPSDRTLGEHCFSIRSLLHSRFTSCELTRCWTSESGAASSHSFFQQIFKVLRAAYSQSSPNSNKIQINTNWD